MEFLLGAIAFNNRVVEAFKMYVRDKTELDDDSRRILQVLLSLVVGWATVGTMAFSGVSFVGTPLEVFADNPFALIFIAGSMVSFGGAFAQPIIELINTFGAAKPEAPDDGSKG